MTDTQAQQLVLLAEDEPLLSMMLEDRLLASGYQVATVDSLEKALEYARTGSMDMAILDINLAGKFSFPVAEILQQRNVPFIFSSGYNDSMVPEEFRNERIIQKPYDTRQLIDALSQLHTKMV
jgi:DNA-binding response OmpR family regulator